VASEFASTLPDVGSAGFPAILGVLFAFLGTAFSLLAGVSREEVQWNAFFLGFVGTGLGLSAYGFGLVTDLY
jgi:hypothetical protein